MRSLINKLRSNARIIKQDLHVGDRRPQPSPPTAQNQNGAFRKRTRHKKTPTSFQFLRVLPDRCLFLANCGNDALAFNFCIGLAFQTVHGLAARCCPSTLILLPARFDGGFAWHHFRFLSLPQRVKTPALNRVGTPCTHTRRHTPG